MRSRAHVAVSGLLAALSTPGAALRVLVPRDAVAPARHVRWLSTTSALDDSHRKSAAAAAAAATSTSAFLTSLRKSRPASSAPPPPPDADAAAVGSSLGSPISTPAVSENAPQHAAAELDIFDPLASLDGSISTDVDVAPGDDTTDVNATLLEENAELWLSSKGSQPISDTPLASTDDSEVRLEEESQELARAQAEATALNAGRQHNEGRDDDSDDASETADGAAHNDENDNDDAEEVRKLIAAVLDVRARRRQKNSSASAAGTARGEQTVNGPDDMALTFFTREELESLLAHEHDNAAAAATSATSTGTTSASSSGGAPVFDSATAVSAEMEAVGDDLTSLSRSAEH